MKVFVYIFTFLQAYRHVSTEIRSSLIVNKLAKVKPVGGNSKFMPLTELPPPARPLSGRRHLECDPIKNPDEVHGGPSVDIIGEYYDDHIAKTVATVIIPEHIDRKFYEVTPPIPYLTVGPIEAIGYHPSKKVGDHPPECEKIYQDHLAEQYSDESADFSEESLEVARMPLAPQSVARAEEFMDQIYSDVDALSR